MVFNSLNFFIFLPIVFITYWFLFRKKLKNQNLFLLIASYIFYGMWDWRFLFLIIASTIVDFMIGQRIHDSPQKSTRKKWLWGSIIFNIGLLGFFKYYNFFIDSWIGFTELMGYTSSNHWTLQIILPVGISFYTFQTMSYSLDIYYKRITPTKDSIAFATFVSFFPQLVAGPIEQASALLPQITTKRSFSYNQCKEGLKLMLWGLFKKVVIADAIAPIVDDIFANYSNYSASTLLLGAFLFSFQIYGDFSGYSDIAIGISKLFGIELSSNFKFPYFSRNSSEFWQKWHISLSNWFRQYVYIPLGGSRINGFVSLRNILIVFLISGFWHGANWTFIVWGIIHAALYIPVFLLKKNTVYKNSIIAENRWYPSIKEVAQLVFTFTMVTLAWIFFRAPSITDAFSFISQLFSNCKFEVYHHPFGYRMIDYFILLAFFILYEFRIRKDERTPFNFNSKFIRMIAYILIIFTILLFYDDHVDRSFIYFQF